MRWIIAGALTVWSALAVFAQPVPAQEALLNQLIFDHCLGYLREGKDPLAGLAGSEPSSADLSKLDRNSAKRIRSGVFKAAKLPGGLFLIWGQEGAVTSCMISRVKEPPSRAVPTGISKDAGLERLTERAARAGLTEIDMLNETLGPIGLYGWNEPGRIASGHRGPQMRVNIVTGECKRGVCDVSHVVTAVGATP